MSADPLPSALALPTLPVGWHQALGRSSPPGWVYALLGGLEVGFPAHARLNPPSAGSGAPGTPAEPQQTPAQGLSVKIAAPRVAGRQAGTRVLAEGLLPAGRCPHPHLC